MKSRLSIRAALVSVIVYVATGQNPMGERVLAELVDQSQNGSVSGMVWDRLQRIPVSGEWSGMGQATVSGPDGRRYELEVVE